MRLIDADALTKKCMNGVDNEFISIVNEMPTIEVLEKIRAEIEADRDFYKNYEDDIDKGVTCGLKRALATIDKYTKGDAE